MPYKPFLYSRHCKKLEGNREKEVPKLTAFALEGGIRVVYNRATGGEKWGKVGN